MNYYSAEQLAAMTDEQCAAIYQANHPGKSFEHALETVKQIREIDRQLREYRASLDPTPGSGPARTGFEPDNA